MRNLFPAWIRFRVDQKGVVSLEYVIVAAAMVTIVAAAFSSDAASALGPMLTSAIGTIGAAIASHAGGG